jgi:hypothetical protein
MAPSSPCPVTVRTGAPAGIHRSVIAAEAGMAPIHRRWFEEAATDDDR